MKIDNYTPEEEILKVSINMAFQWVKTGYWTLRQFAMWHEAKTNASYEAGLNCGIVGADLE